MPFTEALRLALQAIWGAKLRSFFTLLGIIVSVGFLVVVVAVIQGMNAYVKENLTGAMIGTNAFQVRRSPISVGLLDDEQVRVIAKRPLVSAEDAAVVARAIPEAEAVALQSGWPTPISDASYRDRTVGNVLIFGVTPPYQIVQDYQMLAGSPLTRARRPRAASRGRDRLSTLPRSCSTARRAPSAGRSGSSGREVTVTGVIAKKGRVLGQSFDGFMLLPLQHLRVVLRPAQDHRGLGEDGHSEAIEPAMARAEEAMRIAHRLRPGEENDFTVDKADALVAFWRQLTRVLFTAIPAVVCIGIVVGGIVIMNIMLMSVTERTREIGLRKSLGATPGATSGGSS